MKITSVSLSNYSYSSPSGSFIIQDANATVNVNLTKPECERVFALLQTIFFSRQADIAKSIADMKPLSLAAPDAVEGEFTTIDDGVPF